jgi:hypothetical protein
MTGYGIGSRIRNQEITPRYGGTKEIGGGSGFNLYLNSEQEKHQHAYIPLKKPSTPSGVLRMNRLQGWLTCQQGVSGPSGLWRFRVEGAKKSFGAFLVCSISPGLRHNHGVIHRLLRRAFPGSSRRRMNNSGSRISIRNTRKVEVYLQTGGGPSIASLRPVLRSIKSLSLPERETGAGLPNCPECRLLSDALQRGRKE